MEYIKCEDTSPLYTPDEFFKMTSNALEDYASCTSHQAVKMENHIRIAAIHQEQKQMQSTTRNKRVDECHFRNIEK